MMNTTNNRLVYTIEVIKWDSALVATTELTRTTNRQELIQQYEKISKECKEEMKRGVIRDYHITTYEHDTSRHTTYAN